MKSIIALALVGFIFQISGAQTQKISFTKEWGSPLKHENRGDRFLEVIGSDENGAYVMKFNNVDNMLSVELVGKDLHSISSGPLPMLSTNGKPRLYEFSVYMNNQIYIFSSFADKATRKRILYGQLFNKQTRKLETEIAVASIDFDGNTRANSGFFSYRLSLNEKRVLIFAKLPDSFTEPERFEVVVLDEQVKLLWKKQVALPHKDHLFSWESMRVSNEGDVYLLGVAYTDMRLNKRKGKPNYSYELFRYSQNLSNETHKTISLKDQFITDMQIGILPNNDVVCTGFYSEAGTFSIRGTYFIKLDARTNEIVKSQQKEFSAETISEGLTEKQANFVADRLQKGKNVSLPSYNLDRMVVDDAGGVVLVCEDFSIHEVTQKDVSYVQYSAGEIFVLRFSPEGEIAWTKKIAKRQISQSGAQYISYGFGLVGTKLVFLYGGTLFEFVADRLLYVSTVDLEGNLKTESILTDQDPFVFTRPKLSGQFQNGSFLVFGDILKNYQFLKVTVKD